MTTVSASLKMFDMMTRPLQQVTQALNLTISAMDTMSNSANRDVRITNSLNAARESIRRAGAGLQELVNEQDRATNSQNRLNQSFNNGANSSNALIGKVKSLIGLYAGVATIKKGIEATDNYINQSARLSLINDQTQTQLQLQEKIFQAAQRSRGSYGETVSSVAKLGLLAKDAFKGNDETIRFAELMNKSFKVSGASISESSNGMYQLTQAMAAGRLQGDEFRSVMENAPMLAQAIAKYTGKSMGELKQMSADGEITANIIKNALFSAADDINAKFATMPNTFGSIWTSIKNEAVMEFSTIMQKVNDFINTDVGASAISGITTSIAYLANGLGFVIDMVMLATTFFTENSEVIKTVILGLATFAMAKGIQISALWIAANAKYTTTAIGNALLTAQAWVIANWPLLVIIGTILILVGVLMSLGVTTEQVVGVIGGIFGVLGAFIFNIVGTVWNIFASLAEFLVNVFNNPLYAISRLFTNIWNGIMGLVAKAIGGIIDMINLIPGININTDGLSDALKMDIGTPPKNYWEAPKMAMKDFGDSFKWGYSKGANLASGFKMPGSGLDKLNNSSLDKGLGDINKTLTGIDDKLDISNEHLEMLRDLAEVESIQNFVTLTPTVQVTTGDIKETVDIKDVIAEIEIYMENELVNSAEGVYA